MIALVVFILLQAVVIALMLLRRRQRHLIEEKLRLSEERYREVVECQSELVCRYRLDLKLTFVNEAYCRFFGRRREELLGVSFLTLIPEEKHAEIRGVVDALAKSCTPVLYEHQVMQADGSIGWMEWNDFAIVDEKGEVEEFQAIGRDVTQRHRALDALAESERNLAHATRLALLGELTASIAHEINQPLGAILSNAEAAEMLLSAGKTDQVAQILADIRRDDLRASEVIQHVRGLVGRKDPRLERLDVNEVVTRTLGLASAEAQRRAVRIETQLADGLPAIEGERIALKQVLLNLILNGMEAMSETPAVRRRMVVTTQASGPDWVEIAVFDSGPGIPEEKLGRIFDSFFTTKENGMGLGLAMCRSIVEAHRGSIAVENNPRGGAAFRLRLPANFGHKPAVRL